MKLWEADDAELADTVEQFLAGNDPGLDQELVEADVLGSLAHTQMLHEQGYLTEAERDEIHAALKTVLENGIEITAADEDVHTAVENTVTEHTEAGKKMHTGRSRNDQVLLDTRLYTKQQLTEVAAATLSLIEALLDAAEQVDDTIMPGYTHMQQAMPTTAGTWLESYAAGLLDCVKRLEHAYELNDQNPLGAAAGYGTTLDIDRDRTTELLGFATVQENPLYAISSRGVMELDVLSALSQLMLELDRFSNDMLLFSTDEYGFVELPDAFCTGSSIMPQKKNPDVLELVTGKAASVIAQQHRIQLVLTGRTSGYNRDTQETKEALITALHTTLSCVQIVAAMVPDLSFDADAMENAMTEEVYAAYTANKQVEDGEAFRDAYRDVKEAAAYDTPALDELPDHLMEQDVVVALREDWDTKAAAWEEAVQQLTTRST